MLKSRSGVIISNMINCRPKRTKTGEKSRPAVDLSLFFVSLNKGLLSSCSSSINGLYRWFSQLNKAEAMIHQDRTPINFEQKEASDNNSRPNICTDWLSSTGSKECIRSCDKYPTIIEARSKILFDGKNRLKFVKKGFVIFTTD